MKNTKFGKGKSKTKQQLLLTMKSMKFMKGETQN